MRTTSIPLAAAAALTLLACVDSQRPSTNADAGHAGDTEDAGDLIEDVSGDLGTDLGMDLGDGADTDGAGKLDVDACAPPSCSGDEVPVDEDGDGCADTCAPQSCGSPCDCAQPTPEESEALCPAAGWPGFGLYRDCVDDVCTTLC